MTPRRLRIGEPEHVWLLSDEHGRPNSVHVIPTLDIASIPLHWSAKKVTLDEAVKAIASVQQAHVKGAKRMGRLASFVRCLFRASPIPPSISACEGNCQETQCTRAKWQTCEIRLVHERAGGLRVGAKLGRKAKATP
jgi:hypothetical protein